MRYIVLSVPPEPLAQAIRHIQEILSHSTGSKEALRYPPHVTLRTGMVCPDEEAGAAVQAFLKHAGALKAAEIACMDPLASSYRDAGGIERGFLGFDVSLSESLLSLHRQLLAFEPWKKGPQGGYDPHLSLCYHDLSPDAARVALESYRTALEGLRPAWRADAVELWEPSGESWTLSAKATLR